MFSFDPPKLRNREPIEVSYGISFDGPPDTRKSWYPGPGAMNEKDRSGFRITNPDEYAQPWYEYRQPYDKINVEGTVTENPFDKYKGYDYYVIQKKSYFPEDVQSFPGDSVILRVPEGARDLKQYHDYLPYNDELADYAHIQAGQRMRRLRNPDPISVEELEPPEDLDFIERGLLGLENIETEAGRRRGYDEMLEDGTFMGTFKDALLNPFLKEAAPQAASALGAAGDYGRGLLAKRDKYYGNDPEMHSRGVTTRAAGQGFGLIMQRELDRAINEGGKLSRQVIEELKRRSEITKAGSPNQPRFVKAF